MTSSLKSCVVEAYITLDFNEFV